MTVQYANKFTIQILTNHAAGRIVFEDVREPIDPSEPRNGMFITQSKHEVVMVMHDLRSLRDLLNEHIRDEPVPREVN